MAGKKSNVAWRLAKMRSTRNFVKSFKNIQNYIETCQFIFNVRIASSCILRQLKSRRFKCQTSKLPTPTQVYTILADIYLYNLFFKNNVADDFLNFCWLCLEEGHISSLYRRSDYKKTRSQRSFFFIFSISTQPFTVTR